MTQQQYEILSASSKAYISNKEIMILYECELATAKKLKKQILKKIKEDNPSDFERFPKGGRLPIFYLLRKNYLPFSIEDLETFQQLFSDIINVGNENDLGEVKGKKRIV